jgi:hypothetical protein
MERPAGHSRAAGQHQLLVGVQHQRAGRLAEQHVLQRRESWPQRVQQHAGALRELAGHLRRSDLTTAAYSLYATAESNSDSTPPSVAITTPGQGATVFGTVVVSADASDNVGVAGVQFWVDSLDLGAQVTAGPYAVGWDTATTANGPHTLTAVARDTTGNLTTSAPVTVTVLNSPAIVGQWSPLMSWPLVAIHATLLTNGKVLVWDEQSSVTQPKLWDPGTLAFTDTPLVGSELFCAGHTQLADGRVLVAGGHHPQAGEVGTNITYQYDLCTPRDIMGAQH